MMTSHKLACCLAVVAVSVAINANAQAVKPTAVEEDISSVSGRISYGNAPGAPVLTSQSTSVAAVQAVPVGGPQANTQGLFGQPVSWPLVMIHASLTPDGRVFVNGTAGERKGQLIFDVWNPTSGSHLVLPNQTATDIFCSGQSLLTGSGKLLVTGGTTIRNGVNNIGISSTTIFDPALNTLSPAPAMVYERWYPSVVPLASGDRLIVGGRETSTIYTPIPELLSAAGTWRTLTGAGSDAAFGKPGSAWYYPQAYQMPSEPAKVFVLGHNGKMFKVSTTGSGSITQLATTTIASDWKLPSVMFDVGRLLSVRGAAKTIVVNINGPQPSITASGGMSQVRYYSSATVLPDGRVVVTGGSSVGNVLNGAAFAAEIWDPATGRWTLGARAAVARLYHSNALLLPDGTVLTGGGGRPGPLTNLNAETYYPPYLFDASGNAAARPTLISAPESLTLKAGLTFAASVANASKIRRVTLVHAGSSTHNINLEQRFQELTFAVRDNATLTITAPNNPNYTLPGYYLLFVLDDQGVPSEGKMIRILR